MKKEEVNQDNMAEEAVNKDGKSIQGNKAGKKPTQKSGKSSAKSKAEGNGRKKSSEKKTDTKASVTQSIEEKLSESQDKYLRLSAEFDNYRKRTLKEKMDLTKSAGESILNNILPVMDDFDRALQVMENATDCNAMKEGIDLIYTKFHEFLKANGVKEIEVVDADFDTDVHEAITKIPAPSKKQKGKVVDVIQKGYFLNDKVIRYAKVVIGE